MSKYATKIIAILLIVGAFYGAKLTIANKEKTKPVNHVKIPTATIEIAQNRIVPVKVIESGLLSAKYKN